jgi:3-phosphoshikimate 1-carboxyvinyltransferase
MIVRLSPAHLSGKITVPPSKSHAQRLLIAARLAGDKSRVRLTESSADIAACVRCLDALEGENPTLDCGDSGAVLRFLTPVAAMCGGARMTGSRQLSARPMGDLLSALSANGCRISGDTLPFSVSGTLHGGVYTLPGNVSSQFVSGLLFALPRLSEDSEIRLTSPLQSAGYAEMTRSVLAKFGVTSRKTADGFFVPGRQQYTLPAGELVPEGDWSAAAVWLTVNALGGDIALSGLTRGSLQGDERMEKLCGSLPDCADLADIPDLLPLLSVLAAFKKTDTRFLHVGRLRYKESDRLNGCADMICALGGRAEASGDELLVHAQPLSGGRADAQGDHRMAMAAAAAACACRQDVVLSGAESVDKSYPAFWADYQQLGGQMHVL